jgi:RimJ/RimL family protein N-acetyltransferase
VSLVHFLYGTARRVMLEHGSTWTTDLATLNATRHALGLAALGGGPAAWESCELVLVTAPRWLDADAGFPAHVVHAGPLGIRTQERRAEPRAPRVLLSFSTTVMDGQPALIRDVCAAVGSTGAQALLTLGPAVAARDVDAPPGVEVLPWADHDELLPGCAAVVTHAGLGTTLRALAHGVPLLMLPLGRDQHVNATRVTELGAGIRLPADAGMARIRAALSELLADPAFAASASRLADRIAGDRPDRRAVDALERAAGSAGEAPRLRATTARDLDFVLAVEADPDVEPFITPWPRSRHAEAIAAPDQEHLLVIDGGRPAGFILLAGLVDDRPRIELRRIAVSARGAGLGRRALELVLERAFGALGAELVWLDVLPSNARARRAYAAVGFVPDPALQGTLVAAGRVDPALLVMRVGRA